MDNPELYNNANNTQRRDIEDFLISSGHLFEKKFGTLKVIDIGCGDGFVTKNLLRKYLPENVETLMGVDRNPNMINFAKKTYGASNILYKIFDFNLKIDGSVWEKFDILTSFYCFHWLSDVTTVVENMYCLLNSGGLCMFIFPVHHPTYEVYKTISTQSKWSGFVSNGENYFPTIKNVEEIINDYRGNLTAVGFRDVELNLVTKEFEYQGLDRFFDFIKSINPFIKNMHEEQIQEMCDDMLELYKQSPLIQIKYDQFGGIKSVTTIYQVLTGTAFK